MFKVDNVKKSSEPLKKSSVKKASFGESFADYLMGGDVSGSAEVGASATVTTVGAIFATQTVDDEEEKQIRKKLVKKANTLLDNLEEIRQEIIFGVVSKEKLIEISRMVKQKDVETKDKKLKDILDEIELRVEVELAKLVK